MPTAFSSSLSRLTATGGIYCATKAAVSSFNGSLLRELVNTDIRVCEIQPGMVETEFSIVRFRGDKKAADDVYQGLTPCMSLFFLVCVARTGSWCGRKVKSGGERGSSR